LFWTEWTKIRASGRQPVAIKSSQNAYYPLIWADVNRQWQNSFLRAGDIDPNIRGVNHFTKGEVEGSNEGYLDGHAEWVQGKWFEAQNPRMNYQGLKLHFDAGKD
jgi:hypothetical protein